MGALGGLYRPTLQGYNSNPAGCRSQLSVSLVAGFSAGCWGPPVGGSRRLPALGRQAGPTVQGLVGGWLLLLNLGDEGFTEVSVATVLPSDG